MKRRFHLSLLLSLSLSAAWLSPAPTWAQANKVFKFVPHANLAVLDPI